MVQVYLASCHIPTINKTLDENMARPWFPFYFADYSAKTEHLSLVEHGAYLLLMGSYYKTGCKLPANAVQLQRICRAFDPTEVDAMHSVLDQFFILDGDHYIHSRIEEELEKSYKISEKRSIAAKKRYKTDAKNPANADTNAPANAVQLHTQPQPQPQPHNNLIPPYPPALNTDAWNEYLNHRKAIRVKKLKPASEQKLITWLIDQGDKETQANIIDQTIRNGWTGLFELKGQNNETNQQTSKPSLAERATQHRKEFEQDERFDNSKLVGENDVPVRA